VGAREPFRKPADHGRVSVFTPCLHHVRGDRHCRADASTHPGDISNLTEAVRQIKMRVSSIEENVVSMNRQNDPFGQRLERIERRLHMVDV
jgi:hypothetical protein